MVPAVNLLQSTHNLHRRQLIWYNIAVHCAWVISRMPLL